MSLFCGRFEYDGKLGKHGELTIEVDKSGHATWQGWGIGRDQDAPGKLICRCVQGEGRLVLKREHGELVAMVEGHEGSAGDDLTDDLYSADEEDSESDSDTEQAREERWNDAWATHLLGGEHGVSPMDDDALIQSCFGPHKEEDSEEEENAEIEGLESWVEDWFEESLEGIEDFDRPVTYNLHLGGARRWCTGGDYCTRWHESMLL